MSELNLSLPLSLRVAENLSEQGWETFSIKVQMFLFFVFYVLLATLSLS